MCCCSSRQRSSERRRVVLPVSKTKLTNWTYELLVISRAVATLHHFAKGIASHGNRHMGHCKWVAILIPGICVERIFRQIAIRVVAGATQCALIVGLIVSRLPRNSSAAARTSRSLASDYAGNP